MEYLNILNLVRTTNEQEELKTSVASLQSNLYKKSLELDKSSQSQYQQFITQEIIKDLKRLRIDSNKSKMEDYFKSLLVELKNLDTTKIVIAIKPTPKLLDKLNEWIIKTNKQKVIFDIEVDPKILGGAKISNEKGQYIDISLVKSIDDTLLNGKKDINSLI